jgi:CheY-like chemotaxis protein
VTPKPKARRAVLVVEDDTLLRCALVSVLHRFGYDAAAASTVAEGLAQLDGQACAIIDLNLPDGVGTTILERIRAEQRPIRVAVATGTTDDDLLTEALSHRPDVILRKPFDVAALLKWLDDSAA